MKDPFEELESEDEDEDEEVDDSDIVRTCPAPWIAEEDFSTRSGVEWRLFFGSDVSAFSEDFRFCALSVSECGPFIFFLFEMKKALQLPEVKRISLIGISLMGTCVWKVSLTMILKFLGR